MSRTYMTSVLGGVAMAALMAGQGLAADTIKIGVLMPMSGGGAAYGVPAVNGIKLAIDEINAAGGLNGKQLEFIVRDTQLKPDVATAAAKELIAKEGVKILVGAVSSGATAAVSELAKQEKVILFAPISKAISLTGDNLHPYIFQSSANTEIEGRQMAGAVAKLGGKKVCITGFDYAYSHDLYKAFKENLKDAEVTGEYHVKLGTTDYNALISQLMGDECDTVAGAIWGGGFISFVKQAEPFGLFANKKFVWGAEVGSTEMTANLKTSYPEGMIANAYDLWYFDGPESHKKYQAALAKLEGQTETNMYPIVTYVAMQFLSEAIRKAGSEEPDALIKALEGLTVETPLGPRTIDATTHRVNTGEFWGPIKAVEGSDVKRMSPPEYLD
ncbi:MAG: ABC transporter substrate-binding protein [Notoacmeibacter sp.]|nr:ABC transporter substrate-binding protein [Notoacmeibacter sp.]